MDSSSLELKVMYGKDLKAFNFFQKLLLYVLVSIESDDPDKRLKEKLQQRTPTDAEGDGNPEWNHQMRFDLKEVALQDCSHLFVHFDLRHEGLYLGDKTIGEVRVPLKDIVDEISGIVRFVSYEVRTPDGKPNGVLNFSYKVNGKGKDNSSSCEITGYSILHHHHSVEIQYPISEIQSSSSGVHYPSQELGANSQENAYPEQQLQHQSHGTQFSLQQNFYPPPVDAYFPPPPPPLPPPLPPPMLQGACYQSPYPPDFHPWEPGVYQYSAQGNWSPTYGLPHRWPNDFEATRHGHPSFWNGR